MTILFFLMVFVLLAVAAPVLGVDSRDLGPGPKLR